MNNGLENRVKRLEAITDKALQRVVLVFSDEEAAAARQELGPDVQLIHITSLSAPDRKVVPYDYQGKDYAWRTKANQNNQESIP
jgi:hypothetical protein